MSASEKLTDNDLMIIVLYGFTIDFEMIRIAILAKDSTMSLKDFRAHFLVAEGSIESRIHSLSNSMSALSVQGERSSSQGFQGYEHGESSNTQRSQGSFSGDQSGKNFQGGTSFSGNRNGNENRAFQPQQRGNSNNKRFGGGNNI